MKGRCARWGILFASLGVVWAADSPAAIDCNVAEVDSWLLTPAAPANLNVASASQQCFANAPASWVAKSATVMTSLPQKPYGFYPVWQNAGKPLQVDFNEVQRIGWFGEAFTSSGSVADLVDDANTRSIAMRNVALARRFHTGVDLVFYPQEQQVMRWSDLIADPNGPFISKFAASVADKVGRPLDGFLNRFQPYLLLPPIRTAPTAWDGATLFLEGFPFANEQALQFLKNLLSLLRDRLDAGAVWPVSGKPSGQHLALNLVVPFCDLVPDPAACSGTNSALTIRHLSRLIPRAQNDLSVGDNGKSVIDEFVVFLPQPTSDNKKLLRVSIEDAISQANEADVIATHQTVSVAAWRFQMLRRLICVLSPDTWTWTRKGGYTVPGMQFFDDMVYFQDNFQSVGFWPLPTYGEKGRDAELAARTRQVFGSPSRGVIHNLVAGWVVKLHATEWADFFGEYRREISLVAELILAALGLLAVLGIFVFEVAAFCRQHAIWFLATGALVFAIESLLLLFDPGLSQYSGTVFGLTIIAIISVAAVRLFVVGRLEKDLP
ncbi:MAG TPA: hypothetical protein VHZ55_04035 [Bryobacteraceae bacterium]|jgi:hypothetical protein|nr:hypothetical protein [Bryobacteraceae bacterium]